MNRKGHSGNADLPGLHSVRNGSDSQNPSQSTTKTASLYPCSAMKIPMQTESWRVKRSSKALKSVPKGSSFRTTRPSRVARNGSSCIDAFAPPLPSRSAPPALVQEDSCHFIVFCQALPARTENPEASGRRLWFFFPPGIKQVPRIREDQEVPMTVRQILKILRKDGWYIDHQTGSQRQMHHPTKPGYGYGGGQAE